MLLHITLLAFALPAGHASISGAAHAFAPAAAALLALFILALVALPKIAARKPTSSFEMVTMGSVAPAPAEPACEQPQASEPVSTPAEPARADQPQAHHDEPAAPPPHNPRLNLRRATRALAAAVAAGPPLRKSAVPPLPKSAVPLRQKNVPQALAPVWVRRAYQPCDVVPYLDGWVHAEDIVVVDDAAEKIQNLKKRAARNKAGHAGKENENARKNNTGGCKNTKVPV
ncbi:hypothetical protein B0H15DRAFT_833110 [Mycena belliarum]|uniref:Uncharacterized protein n=1 Tax=Mycena belliarum TaxID=1033014 RepID=A0AAD6XPA3_9AGAR|nr:hypothetical protein B0H15DRAFT_833110 [Mycena belliae]